VWEGGTVSDKWKFFKFSDAKVKLLTLGCMVYYHSLLKKKNGLMLKVLDNMLFYLRIVHSFDYYNTMEYPNEDEMPHRCGIIHCRGAVPTGQIVQSEGEWVKPL